MSDKKCIKWTGHNLREVIDAIGLHPSASKWTWEEYEAVVKKEGLKVCFDGTWIKIEIGYGLRKDGDTIQAIRKSSRYCGFYTIEWLSNGKWCKILHSQRKRHLDDVFETLCDGHKPLEATK